MYTGPNIVRDGLILQFDPANIKCFRGEPTVNLWSGVLYIYNNYGVPATLVVTGEKYQGYTVYRLGMPVTDAYSSALTSFRTDFWSHGVYGGSMTFKANTKYAASIIWKPINKFDVIVGGTASNIGGWTSQPIEDLKNGWFRYTQTRNGSVTTDKSDSVFHSFISPSLQLNETVYIDFCCPQIEEKGYSTPYTPTSRGTTVATGGGLIDLSNNQNHGVIINNILYDSNNCGSLKFDGVNDYINTNFSLNTNPSSFDIWFYIDDIPTSYQILFINQYNNTALGFYNTNYFILSAQAVFKRIASNTTLNLHSWNNVIVTYDINGLPYCHINGIETTYSNTTNYWNSVARPLLIGCREGSSNDYNTFFTGKIGLFKIYNRQLTQSEIQQNYNSMKSRYI